MKALLCATLALAGAWSPPSVRSEDKPDKPVPPAPVVELNWAAVKDGKVVGTSMKTTVEYLTRTQFRVVDGKTVTEILMMPRATTMALLLSYPLKNAKATMRDGTEIAAADLAAKVEGAKTVAVFPTESKPSAEAMMNFAEDTVFVELLEKK